MVSIANWAPPKLGKPSATTLSPPSILAENKEVQAADEDVRGDAGAGLTANPCSSPPRRRLDLQEQPP